MHSHPLQAFNTSRDAVPHSNHHHFHRWLCLTPRGGIDLLVRRSTGTCHTLLRLPVPLGRRGPLMLRGNHDRFPNWWILPLGFGGPCFRLCRRPGIRRPGAEHDVRQDGERRGGEAQQGRPPEVAVPDEPAPRDAIPRDREVPHRAVGVERPREQRRDPAHSTKVRTTGLLQASLDRMCLNC